MAKIVLLSVIAVTVSAQFNPNRHRNEHIHVGGFQNGHFAQHDGRLRTNLDSQPSNDNNQRRDERPYIVEEGAAFKRREEQYDVHSSLGRVVDISSAIQNNNEREYIGNDNRRDQRRTNANQQAEVRQEDQSNEDISDQNDQTGLYQANENIFNAETQPTNQESRNQDEGQARQSGQSTDAQETNSQNKFDNENTQQITVKNTSTRNNKPVSNVNIESYLKVNQSYDKAAIDREMNNQLTRMIFTESVLEVTTKSSTKTTKDNELPKSSETEGDRWIWSDGKNVSTTATPTVDDRAAFVGDKCPTGQVRFNNVCVDVDGD